MYLSAPAGASFAGGTNGGSDRVSGGSQRIDPHTDEWSTHLGAEGPPSPVAGRGLDHQGTRPTPSAPCLLEWGARSGGGGNAFEHDDREDTVSVLLVLVTLPSDPSVEPVALFSHRDDGLDLERSVAEFDRHRRIRTQVVKPRRVLGGPRLGGDHEHASVIDGVPERHRRPPPGARPGRGQEQDGERRLTDDAGMSAELVDNALVVGQELLVRRHSRHDTSTVPRRNRPYCECLAARHPRSPATPAGICRSAGRARSLRLQLRSLTSSNAGERFVVCRPGTRTSRICSGPTSPAEFNR